MKNQRVEKAELNEKRRGVKVKLNEELMSENSESYTFILM